MASLVRLFLMELILFKVEQLAAVGEMLFHRQCRIHEEAEISCTAGKWDVSETSRDQ